MSESLPAVDEPLAARRSLPQQAADLVRPLAGTLTSPTARQGMLSIVDQAVVSAASFLTTVIVARATSREDLGIYYLALTLVLFARGIQAQLVFAPYVVYCHRREGNESAEYAGSVLVHQLILSAMAVVCLAALAGVLWLGIGPPALAPAIWVLLGALPLLQLREFYRSYSLCHLKVGVAVAVDATTAALQVGVLLVLWRFRLLSVASAYAMMGGAAAIVCLEWFACRRGRWRIQPARIAADWINNWSFARWALASFLIGCVSPYVMPWILAAVHGEASAGLLGACGTLAGIANMFVMGLGNFVSPKAARAFADKGRPALCRVLGTAAAVFGVVVGGLCLFSLFAGEWLVVFVYGRQFAGGGPVLAAYVASVLAISIGMVAGNGLWAIDRPKAALVPDLCALAVTLATAALLVGPLGALGVALAVLAGAATGAVMKSFVLFGLIRSLPIAPTVEAPHP